MMWIELLMKSFFNRSEMLKFLINFSHLIWLDFILRVFWDLWIRIVILNGTSRIIEKESGIGLAWLWRRAWSCQNLIDSRKSKRFLQDPVQC
jgi:hypothetical protein